MKQNPTELARWMDEEGLTAEALAQRVDRDRTRVIRWRNDKGKPDIEALAKLETLSNGRITAKSFFAQPA